MHYDIDRKHREHLPVPDMFRTIITHRIKHHEAAYQKAHYHGMLGIGELRAVFGLRDLDKHQQNRKYRRADTYYKLDCCIRIDVYRNHNII